MSSVGLSSSLASLLGTGSSSSGINLSSLLQAAMGSSSQGIDVSAAVNAAVTAARAPEQQWKAQQTLLQSQENDLKTISSAVTTLEDDLATLNSGAGVLSSVSITSSDAGTVTAFASTGATTGTHVINVGSLATSSSWYSSFSVTNRSDALGSGSLSIQVGNATPTRISIAQDQTIDQLADVFNQISGINASVISDANGFRLSVTSEQSGAANNIVITNTSPQFSRASDGSAWQSESFADSTGLTAGAMFSIEVGGTTTQIEAREGESLQDIAIDMNGRIPGVTASVTSDGEGSSHLSIVSDENGDATGVNIINASPAFVQAAVGKNASLTVDGIPVSSATNTVSGVIPGVTIKLTGSGSGKDVTLSVAPNNTSINSAINQFVTDYNTVIGYVNTEYTYNPGSSAVAPLAGDSALGLLQSVLLGAGGYTATNNGTGWTLNSLGISMNNDGTLVVDSAKLNDAVQNNFSSVQKFFQGDLLEGFSNTLTKQLQGLTDGANGAFTVDLSSMQSTYKDLDEQVNNFEANYISSLQARLTAEYNAAEIALQTLNTTRQQIDAELGNNSSRN